MQVAHRFVIDNWATIQSGQVVDVEFILGETKQPKCSERIGETNIVRTLREMDRVTP